MYWPCTPEISYISTWLINCEAMRTISLNYKIGSQSIFNQKMVPRRYLLFSRDVSNQNNNQNKFYLASTQADISKLKMWHKHADIKLGNIKTYCNDKKPINYQSLYKTHKH